MNKDKIFVLLFFITLFVWCIAISYPFQPDYDLWARLIAGKSVVENGIILRNDVFSYTPTHIWYDHEWLSGTIFYYLTTIASKIHKTIIETLGLFKALLTFSIFAIAAICVYIKKPNNSSAFQILYFAIAALCANIAFASTIRCHMFTFLFFVFWILILETYRQTNRKFLLAILPITMIAWGNLHGGCLSGLGLLIMYTIGEYLNKKDIRPYVLTLIVSFFTLFINPYGTSYVKFLFTAGLMDRGWISEWNSPFLMIKQTSKFIMFFIFMCFIALMCPLTKQGWTKDKTKIILVIVTGLIAVLHAKLIPFFVITASIFMFNDVYNVLRQFVFLKWTINHKNLFVYALLLILALNTIDMNVKNRYGVINHAMYPYKAVQFLRENTLIGHLFTEFSYGSYCIYKLYPQNKIFMDGRYEEVYNPNLINVMKDFIKQEGENPNAVLTDYKTDIVLLFRPANVQLPEQRQKVFKALEDLKWQKIYKDEFFEIYLRPEYPKKIFTHSEYEPLKHSLMMFETNITKDILKRATTNNKITPFNK